MVSSGFNLFVLLLPLPQKKSKSPACLKATYAQSSELEAIAAQWKLLLRNHYQIY